MARVNYNAKMSDASIRRTENVLFSGSNASGPIGPLYRELELFWIAPLIAKCPKPIVLANNFFLRFLISSSILPTISVWSSCCDDYISTAYAPIRQYVRKAS